MKILGYTSYADTAYDLFKKAASNKAQPRLSLLNKKMKLCDYQVLLVSHFPLNLEKINDNWYDPQMLIALHSALVSILGKGLEDKKVRENGWAVIDGIGEPLSPDYENKGSAFFRKFFLDPSGKHFFILLTGYEPDGLPVYDLNFLCNLWQLENGYTPIHSASIIHKGNLFLFCGPHASGKSTIARMSQKRNNIILDEDLVLIPHLPTMHFEAQAWGYSLATSAAPMRAILKIVQDNEDCLLPLTQTQTAHFLVERSIEVLGYPLHDNMMDKLFKQIASLARQVPGYELHFRKSPDFWNLIDEQILV